MLMSKRLRGAVLGTLLALAAVGVIGWLTMRVIAPHPDTERYRQRQPGVMLVDGFRSYSSVADALSLLQARARLVSRRTLARPPDRRYPPHALDSVTVERYPLLGTTGRLSLQFFNDRLLEVGFEPDDAAAAAAALKLSYPALQRDRNGRAEWVEAKRRIATNVELASSSVGRSLTTQPYVLWQDMRLIRQRDAWDQAYGALPYKMQ